MFALPAEDNIPRSRAAKATRLFIPQEDLLQRFLYDVSGHHDSWVTTRKGFFGEKPVHVCEWYGVECNVKKEVVSLKWRQILGLKLGGVLSWGDLPHTVQIIRLENNVLRSSIDFPVLPDGLLYLDLTRNRFSGTIDGTRLPPHIRSVRLGSNRFTGILDLTLLPYTLEHFSAPSNEFIGTPSLKYLPDALKELDLRENLFQWEGIEPPPPPPEILIYPQSVKQESEDE